MRQNKNILVIISLIFAYPIGLFFLWKKSNLKKSAKLIVTLLFSLFIPAIFIFLSIFNHTDRDTVSISQIEKYFNSENSENKEKDIKKSNQPGKKETKEYETEKNENRVVYITSTGKKYHYKNACGRGKYIPILLEEAKKLGYSPCMKCTE